MDTSPIRLIAVDLDGTVLDDRKQLTPRTLEALRAAGRQGVLIVPATGRTHAGLPPELLALPGVRRQDPAGTVHPPGHRPGRLRRPVRL